MYSKICVAGTFDGLHAGHEALLLRAFAEGEHVLIGITSDTYVAEHKQSSSRAYDIRVGELTTWLEHKGLAERATIVAINDPFEPAASDPALDALIVSAESEKRGVELNYRRASLGLNTLALVVVPMLKAEDLHPISATRVRAGVIDREGKLLMPETLREELTKPLGNVLAGVDIHRSFMAHKDHTIISVGDCTTMAILDAGIIPRLMIVDNKVNRKDFRELQPIVAEKNIAKVTVQSGPGFISHTAIDAIRRSFVEGANAQSLVIEVDGEEDLLTLPAVIYAPLGAVVYYGQPGAGLIEVHVNNDTKAKVKGIMGKFT